MTRRKGGAHGDVLTALIELGATLSRFERVLETRIGLSLSQWHVLDRLLGLPAASATELAAASGVTAGTLTQMLGRLARKGLVYVGSDPGDRRRKVIAITRSGKQALDVAAKAASIVARPRLRRMTVAIRAAKAVLEAEAGHEGTSRSPQAQGQDLAGLDNRHGNQRGGKHHR